MKRPPKRKRGRPRKHVSNAAKQAALRDRKRDAPLAAIQSYWDRELADPTSAAVRRLKQFLKDQQKIRIANDRRIAGAAEVRRVLARAAYMLRGSSMRRFTQTWEFLDRERRALARWAPQKFVRRVERLQDKLCPALMNRRINT